MSLKDEIEKLIQQEQQKIEESDQRNVEFRERQRQRFQSLRTLFKELVASVDSKHIESHIFDSYATLEVGERKGDHFSAETRWEVQPNFNFGFGRVEYEKSGFRMEETNYYHAPELDHSESKHEHIFDTEREIAEYIIKQIA